MAQTKRKTKHRGNAAGMVESRGRTGRPPTAEERKGDRRREKAKAREQQLDRRDRPPTWRGAFVRAMIAAIVMLLIGILLLKNSNEAFALFPVVLVFYIPISYYTDKWMYKRRQRQKANAKAKARRRRRPRRTRGERVPDVRTFTVGPVQENSYIATPDRARGRALMIDPGDEPERLLDAARALGVEIEAILAHPLPLRPHRRRGARRPRHRRPRVLPGDRAAAADRRDGWVPPGFGPFENYEAEHTLAGGERLRLAGFDIEVLFTPGHSPGHLTYALTPGGGGRRRATAASPGAAVRRRPVPGVGREGGSARRRLAHAGAVDRDAAGALSRGERWCTRGTWASRRCGGSADTTRSWRSSARESERRGCGPADPAGHAGAGAAGEPSRR